MTAPAADSPQGSGRESTSPGQRMLAAIIFTDTVGFSARMRKDEEQTLHLIARDLSLMKETCAKFEGQVLKSTGDGLLMLFTSAVGAVSCALEIQRRMMERNLDLPRPERLSHRIGIHLGDVVQGGGDVMGDGVNVAARLQTQAAPGGICISKTVYDVVENRIPLHVYDRGRRRLKNIGTVTAYFILPDACPPWHFHGLRRWLPALAGVALVAVLLGGSFLVTYRLGAHLQQVDDLQRIAHQLNPAGPTITTSASATPALAGKEEVIPPLPGPYPAPGKIAATDADFEIARYNYMNKYNFGAMAAWLEKYDAPSTDEVRLDEVCKALRALFGWCTIEMQNYSADQPLRVPNDRGDEALQFWPEPSGGVMLRTGTGVVALSREQIWPSAYAGIAAQLIRENAKPGTPSTLQLWRGVQLFVDTYHVTVPPALQRDLDAAAVQRSGMAATN